MQPTDPLARIAELRRTLHAIVLDNGVLLVTQRSPLPALLDIAEKAIAFVGKCPRCDGTEAVCTTTLIPYGRCDCGNCERGPVTKEACAMCAPLRAAIKRLTEGQ